MKTIKKENFFVLCYCFFSAFYLLYLPDFSLFFKFLKPSLVVFTFAVFHLLIMWKRIVNYIINTKLISVFFFYILSFIYLLIVVIMREGQWNSIISNMTGIAQMINICAIALLLKDRHYDYKEMIRFLIYIGLVQAFFCIIMFYFPEAKEFANALYLQNDETGTLLSIVGDRVYGVSSNYTFLLPVTMSFIAYIAIVFAFCCNEKKFYIYGVILLWTSLMNGRTGIYICFTLILLLPFYFMLKKYKFTTSILLICGGILFGSLTIYLLNKMMPEKIEWALNGLRDFVGALKGDEYSGNMKALADKMVFFPNGSGFIFGEGHRVFGTIGIETVGKHSDIGYINDIYKGGIFYYLLFYIPMFFFLIRQAWCIGNQIDHHFVHTLFLGSFLFLLFANYKGEAITGTSLVMCFVYIYIAVAN